VTGANLKPASIVKLYVKKTLTAQAVNYGTLLATAKVKSNGTFILKAMFPVSLTPGT
jgi:hypothetical protein